MPMSRPSTTPPAVLGDPGSLAAHEHRAHRRVVRDRRHRARDLGSPDLGRHVTPADAHHAVTRGRAPAASASAATAVAVVERQARLHRGERDRAVHRAGVEGREAAARRRRRARPSTCPSPRARRSRPRRPFTPLTTCSRSRPALGEEREVGAELGVRHRRGAEPTDLGGAVERVPGDRARRARSGGRRGCRPDPASGRPPRIARPSALVSTPTPSARERARRRVSTRSLSFTRSSAASVISVTPSANAAATASTGISSCTLAISSPAMVVADSGAARTRRSPTGSPSSSPVRTDLDVGAHARSTSTNPVRVGLRPTRLHGDSDPGVIAGRHAPERGRRRVARDRRARTHGAHRAGTRTVGRPTLDRRAQRGEHPLGVVAAGPRATRSRSCHWRRGRRARSRSSPARSPPGARGRDAVQARRRARRAARASPSSRPSTCAPIAPQRVDHPAHRAGPAGWRRRSAPTGTGRPPSRPAVVRIVVPELPQSSTSPGSRQPVGAATGDLDDVGAGGRARDAEGGEHADGAAHVVAPGEAADGRRSVGQRGEQQGAVRDALVPGHAEPATQRRRAADARAWTAGLTPPPSVPTG